MTADLIREKVAQAASIVRELGIDCWITFARETHLSRDPALEFLVTSDLTWHSAMVISASGEACAIVGEYDRRMVEDTGAYAQVVGYVEGIRKPLQTLLSRLAPRSIALNYSRDSEICDGLTHGMYLVLHDMLDEIGLAGGLVSAEGIISALRQRKTPSEIAWIREAVRSTEDLFTAVGRGPLRPGATEEAIAGFLRAETAARGLELAWDPKTCPAVFTGPDTAQAHYSPTGRVVERGHVLNMDFGVKVGGYCSDLQRTWYVLEEGETAPPAEVQHGFDTILLAIETSRRALRPGARGQDVDRLARETLKAAGYEEFPHALGHQVGRHAHDGTVLLGPAWEKYGKKPFLPIEVGMVFTLEPRLTVPKRGVVTIEEMVIVKEDGAEYISTPQKKILLVR